ncbi:hypothetical protein X801_02945 [Opisthorchis viverrini]|uniref:Uncharacterized protein n=1 Tax=Opisthorchis viverrini TaxID=6198 RepID=A0A1S8X365_OPIVI|nr:hypothetical protein X801_02945 [Opisthorchis viverrini]
MYFRGNWKFFARADGYSDDDEAVQALEGRDEDTSYENTYLSQDTGEKSNAEDPDSNDGDSPSNDEPDESSDSSSGDEVQTIEEEYSSSNDDDQSSGNGHVFDEPNEDAERPEEEDLSEIEGSGFHDVDSFPNTESDESSDSSSGDEKHTAEEVANSSEAPGSSPDDRSSESEVDGGPQVDESETGEAVNAEKEERTVGKRLSVVSKKQFIPGIPGECTADDYDGKLHGLQIATYQIQMESSVSSSQLFAQLKKPNTHGNNCRFNGYLQ